MSGDGLRLDPSAAARIVNGCFNLSAQVDSLLANSGVLTGVSASGTYQSGSRVDKKLSDLGEVALRAMKMLKEEVDKAGAAARAAGQALLNQDDENQSSIRRALDAPDGVDPVQHALPGGPIGYGGTPSTDPLAGAASMAAPFGKPEAGVFPMGLIPEALPNFALDPAVTALGPALPAALTTLSSQWAQLASQLRSAFGAFDGQISVLGTDVFSGTAAGAMKRSLDTFSQGGKRVADEAQANSAVISAWAGWVGQSKLVIEGLRDSRTTSLATATPENALKVRQTFDELSQMQLKGLWNPPLSTMNGSMVNLSDPSSPVAGVPLYPPGMGPKSSSDGSNPIAIGQYSSRSSGGSGGGGGGGGGSAAAAAKSDASQLQRAGSGTAPPVGTKGGTAPPAGAPSSGNGDPVSAVSQAGKSAEGLTRGGLGSAATKSASAGALKDAAADEKAAAAKSALQASKGGGAGGGGAGGAGGLGKIGATEGSLSSRSMSGLSAAERATVAEPAASSRAPAGGAGAPMGGRGASPTNSESEGKHKSARYLQSTENGEEIVGDIEDVAPMVIGGLNLDTSDDTTTPSDKS